MGPFILNTDSRMWQTHTDAPFKTCRCSLQGKYGFSFLSVYSIGVNTDFDFVTGEVPIKVSKCCWFPLGVWWELQGTVESAPGTMVCPCLPFSYPLPPDLGWWQSPKAQQQNSTTSTKPQSVQLCQHSSGLHRNTVTLGKRVALGMCQEHLQWCF